MEVYLIRHTTPQVEKGICYGQTDLELASTFKKEFEKVQSQLPPSFDLVYSSPLKRCSQLAQYIGKAVIHEESLKELDFGGWEMKRWSEIDQAQLNDWMGDFVEYQVPGGESFTQLIERIESFWLGLLAKPVDKVAIFTHAGPIRCIIGKVLGMPHQNYFKLEHSYGGVSKIQVAEGFQKIEFINHY